jgi:hypothetical protein
MEADLVAREAHLTSKIDKLEDTIASDGWNIKYETALVTSREALTSLHERQSTARCLAVYRAIRTQKFIEYTQVGRWGCTWVGQ